MTFTQDILSILTGAVAIFWARERTISLSVLVGAIVLAVFCWWACSRYSSFWNTSYKMRMFHHVMCALAALITFFVVVLFAVLKQALPAAWVSVGFWEGQVQLDKPWAEATFAEAYQRVEKLGLEDFRNHHPPPAGKRIPLTHELSQLEYAMTYAEAGASHFNRSRPYLSSVIKARSEVPRELLREDVERYFKDVGKRYPAPNAIAVVAREVKSGLEEQLPDIVKSLRLQLIVVFFACQFIPFALVGWAAYRDLEVRA